jgi:curli biogenesis system outer membrane secretion channel CsgG
VEWAIRAITLASWLLAFELSSGVAQTGVVPANHAQAQQAQIQSGQTQQPRDNSEPKLEPDVAVKLLKVKRIYVDSFGDDAASKQLQAMVVNALVESKKFIITENKDKADAVLRGAALEKTSQELHASGDATSVGAAAGAHTGSVTGSVVNGNGSVSGSSSGGFIARHMGTSDSVASTETINDARVAVRLVASDGDVIWATTKESKGAKYKGASADVADMIVVQLLRDLEKLGPATK